MSVEVRLKDLVDSMQMQSEDVSSYLNIETGKVVEVTTEELSAVDGGDGDSEFDKDMLQTAREVMAGKPYIPLPDRFEINEYDMMQRFAESLPDDSKAEILLTSLRGSGAFRRFKDTAHILGVIEGWYQFKNDAYEKVAIEWCEDHGIEYRRE
ncbi:MAG: UPF0158 family protein [Candidatus Zixiibacteriota bacterium]